MGKKTACAAARAAMTFTGTVIGAGFASGQEIVQFFISYGTPGGFGIVLAGLLLGWLGGRLLEIGRISPIPTFSAVLPRLCGRLPGSALSWITSLFLFGTCSIMFAGAAAVGSSHLGIPQWISLPCSGALCAAVSLYGIRGITAANALIAPLLTLAILAVSLGSLHYHHEALAGVTLSPAPFRQAAPHWLTAALLYASYNLALSAAVLIPLGKTMPDRRSCLLGGALGGLTLGFLAAALSLVILLHTPSATSAEVPILDVARARHELSGALYAAILLAAIFTTALSCLYGLVEKISIHPLSGWFFFDPIRVYYQRHLKALSDSADRSCHSNDP